MKLSLGITVFGLSNISLHLTIASVPTNNILSKNEDIVNGSCTEDVGCAHCVNRNGNKEILYIDPADPTTYSMKWDEISPYVKKYYGGLGWTQKYWDKEEDPIGVNPYDVSWAELQPKQRSALEFFGWNQVDFTEFMVTGVASHDNPPNDCTKLWQELIPSEKNAAFDLGFNETTWHRVIPPPGTPFKPEKMRLSLPATEKFDFDYLAELDIDVEVCELDDNEGDDEFGCDKVISMKEFIKEVVEDDLDDHYLKYEDTDIFKDVIDKKIGSIVRQDFKSALKSQGMFLPEWEPINMDSRNWVLLVGADETYTRLHLDWDAFNFLWVLEGRKRIILIPNTGQYECKVYLKGHSCWPDIDIFNSELPPEAVVVELGPGEGVSIPYQSWHAVQNLDATIAYGFRIIY